MKNYFMELIQKNEEIPENGVNYFESVEKVGGEDHNPIFAAKVRFGTVKEYSIESLTVIGTTKKQALKQAWKQLYEECIK